MDPWSSNGNAGLGTGRDSACGAWLGGQNNTTGQLTQWINIPAAAGPVTWEFWWKAEAASPQHDGVMHVFLQDMAGGEEPLFLTLPADGALDEWRHVAVDLSAWAGRMVLAGYLVRTDGSIPTTFRVDDVSVRACVRP